MSVNNFAVFFEVAEGDFTQETNWMPESDALKRLRDYRRVTSDPSYVLLCEPSNLATGPRQTGDDLPPRDLFVHMHSGIYGWAEWVEGEGKHLFHFRTDDEDDVKWWAVINEEGDK